VKLCEHSDFQDAISAAKEHFNQPGLTEQFIEKDYYVTEALRIVADGWSSAVIFKGGTSLSKGWKIIERFSEDVDLFLHKEDLLPASNKPLGRKAVNTVLKAIESSVSEHPGLTFLPDKKRSTEGINRSSYFSYPTTFTTVFAIENNVLLETGIRSGNYPIHTTDLSSYLADFLQETGDSLEADDESSFSMRLLHFKRTFVEKLFLIHSKVIHYQSGGAPIGTYARHYYDLFCLAQKREVQELLQSEDYSKLKNDCDRVSQEHFRDYHNPPADLMFAESTALFPWGELRKTISKEYTEQCKNLCYGSYPSWDEVEGCFETLRKSL